MSLESLEARQLLATGPQLVSIKPDADTVLQNFDVLETSPRELRFIFSQGQAIDPTSLDGIVVTRSGKDQSFERAGAVSDLGTQGAAVFRFTASDEGIGGNSVFVAFKLTDFGGAGGPVATVEDRTVRVELNSNPQHLTTASQMLNALNANPEVTELLTASLIAGSPVAPVVTASTAPATIPLDGANQARAYTSLGASNALQVEFQARQSGPAGAGIAVSLQHADRGAGAAPLVSVQGKSITVTLNTNASTPTTALGFVTALQNSTAASALVRTSLRAGVPATDVATTSVGLAPIALAGGTDIAVTPAYSGLDPDRSNEVIVRFAETLPDDLYSIDILGAGTEVLQNTAGEAFDCETNTRVLFQVDRGAQVIAVVPQPVSRNGNGTLQQTKNVIDVYFNDDDLNLASATNPEFYRLIKTQDTVENTDDSVYLPTSISYDPATDRARLTFGTNSAQFPGGPGTYRLRIGTAESLPMPPEVIQPQAEQTVDVARNLAATVVVPVTFTAAEDFGRAVRVELTASNFGGPGLPRVVVSGDTVAIELNSNETHQSTVQDLITALDQSVLGSRRLHVSADAGRSPFPLDVECPRIRRTSW